ncbi:MAG: hypothetical protein ACPK7O_00510 [Methanobacterium sp.]
MDMFMAHMTHSAGSCYLFNDETRKVLKERSGNKEEAAKKHDVKVLYAVYPPLEHEMFYLLEAPDYKAVERYLKEVGFAHYNKIKIRHVESMELALDRI